VSADPNGERGRDGPNLAADEVELDPVHQRLVGDRSGMRGAAP
jgi:hypothetical protein